MTPLALRIATWNIRKGKGTDRRRDPSRVLAVLAEMQADVVLLQEADFRLPPRPPALAREALRQRAGLVAVDFGGGRGSLGWHGNAMLLRPGIEVSAARGHDLPGLEPRGLIEAELRIDGRLLRVIGVHLGLLRTSRRMQLSELNRILAQAAAMPTLIAGDFNERSLSEGLGRLARRFRILSGGPTYHSRWPMFPLDRIALTPEFDPLRVAPLRTEATGRASDHLPLIADLRLAPADQSIAGNT